MPSDPFAALASPVRRALLEELLAGPRTAGELAGVAPLSRSAASEHLAVLRDAGLVSEERRGRNRMYRLEPDALGELARWLRPFEHYWNERLDALETLLDEENPRHD